MSRDYFVDGAMQATFYIGPNHNRMVQLNWEGKYIAIPVELLYHLVSDPDIKQEIRKAGYEL